MHRLVIAAVGSLTVLNAGASEAGPPDVEFIFELCAPPRPSARQTYDEISFRAHRDKWPTILSETTQFDPGTEALERSAAWQIGRPDGTSVSVMVKIAHLDKRTVESCKVVLASTSYEQLQSALATIAELDLISERRELGRQVASYAFLETERQSVWVNASSTTGIGGAETALEFIRSFKFSTPDQ